MFPIVVFANLSHLTCSKSGTDLIFINGIWIHDGGYRVWEQYTNSMRLHLQANMVDVKGSVEVQPRRNHSAGVLEDLYENYEIYLESQTNPVNLDANRAQFIRKITNNPRFSDHCESTEGEKVCHELFKIDTSKMPATVNDLGVLRENILERLKDHRKIIFVTHSGGAAYAESLRTSIKLSNPEYNGLIGHVAMAPSYPSIHGYKQMTFVSDRITNVVRGLTFGATPDGNYTLINDCGVPAFMKDHDFPCYMGEKAVLGATKFTSTGIYPGKTILADLIYQAAEELGNNEKDNPKCCYGAAGKVWFSSSGNSFVSNKTKIQSSVNLVLNNSEICGEYNFKGSNNITISGSKLDGRGEFNSTVQILNSNFSIRSVFNFFNNGSFPSISQSLYMKDLNVNSEVNVSGNIEFYDMNINAPFFSQGKLQFYPTSPNRIFDYPFFTSGKNIQLRLNPSFTGVAKLYGEIEVSHGTFGSNITLTGNENANNYPAHFYYVTVPSDYNITVNVSSVGSPYYSLCTIQSSGTNPNCI